MACSGDPRIEVADLCGCQACRRVGRSLIDLRQKQGETRRDGVVPGQRCWRLLTIAAMQVYERLVARNERQVCRVFDQDQLAPLPFQKDAHAGIRRGHVAQDVPYSRSVEIALSLQNLDRSNLDALGPHVLRGQEMEQRYAALLVGVETDVLPQSAFQQGQEGCLDSRVIVLQRVGAEGIDDIVKFGVLTFELRRCCDQFQEVFVISPDERMQPFDIDQQEADQSDIIGRQFADFVEMLLDGDRSRTRRKYSPVHQTVKLPVGAPRFQIMLPDMVLPVLLRWDGPTRSRHAPRLWIDFLRLVNHTS